MSEGIKKNRIGYIDSLRGLAIGLLVPLHVIGMSMPDNFLFRVLNAFILPLFFFVSGLVSYVRPGTDNGWARVLKRISYQLVPTIIMCVVQSYLIHLNLLDVLFMPFKNGFWFVYNLICYYCIYLLAITVIRRVGAGKATEAIALIVIGLVFCYMALNSSLFANPAANVHNLSGLLGLKLYKLVIYFFAGIVARMYYSSLVSFLQRRGVLVVLFAVSMLNVYAIYRYSLDIDVVDIFSGIPVFGNIFVTFYTIFVSTSLVLTLFAFFSYYPCFNGNSWIHTVLGKLGNNSLEIYLLQCYFMAVLSKFNIPYTIKHSIDSMGVSVLVCVLISIAIIVLCMILIRIIDRFPVIARWTLGRSIPIR